MVHTNSIQTYKTIVEPSLSKREEEVLSWIKRYPGKAISQYANLMLTTPNVISGRFGKLREKGKIVETGTIYLNGRPNALWQVKSKTEQLNLF